ncbi:hypothetical protein J7E50_24700 [Pedobacter sp. ISL-68]|nr:MULTISPECIES: hypothetical protein [unclassified Pedobacter]MBT2563106.1 hypothetical protein [Pedobacter sp. ISL-64]MBT2593444.1 hypothetical protein [Pedobacter sp. ISL-68]
MQYTTLLVVSSVGYQSPFYNGLWYDCTIISSETGGGNVTIQKIKTMWF